uniref:Uncharacterized protein n=1 Tax=Arundo donax TaxID=35708 RepID=A0A0A9GIG3_ARUDO
MKEKITSLSKVAETVQSVLNHQSFVLFLLLPTNYL